MSALFKEIEKQARMLTPQEKVALARLLIEELDSTADPDVERLWIGEAQRRYQAFLKNEMPAVPGDEAMNRARRRLT